MMKEFRDDLGAAMADQCAVRGASVPGSAKSARSSSSTPVIWSTQETDDTASQAITVADSRLVLLIKNQRPGVLRVVSCAYESSSLPADVPAEFPRSVGSNGNRQRCLKPKAD